MDDMKLINAEISYDSSGDWMITFHTASSASPTDTLHINFAVISLGMLIGLLINALLLRSRTN